MIHSKKAQSAVEYILLAACFIAFLIFFLSPSGRMRSVIEENVNKTADQIHQMAEGTDFSKPFYCGDGACCSNPAHCDPVETAENCCSDCGDCGGGGGGGGCIPAPCLPSSDVQCGTPYYEDNCHHYCGLGSSCPAPNVGCKMTCKGGGGCIEDCTGGNETSQ